ncbi:hypothetical protein DSUL_20271 [Desulfovibrionales bacterium]
MDNPIVQSTIIGGSGGLFNGLSDILSVGLGYGIGLDMLSGFFAGWSKAWRQYQKFSYDRTSRPSG